MSKPPYRVPSMEEIRAIPWNGFNVISTFSGCGGSSLGYRMAGFRVLWASEFIDAARDSYAANKADYTIIDPRDIRQVSAENILSAINLAPGELDLFDGSPPCASFSTAGKRQAGWGKVKKYSDKVQRTDDLFFEYARLVDGVQPKVFVAENVSGLVKGVAKGYFLEILNRLKACGYRVQAKLLDAQWLGVPQARQRLIFIGVRNDLGLDPVFPKPLNYQYSLREAWGDSLRVAPIENETSLEPYKKGNGRFWFDLKPGQGHKKRFTAGKMPINRPAFTITQSFRSPGAANRWHPLEFRCISVAETKRLCAFPDDFRFVHGYCENMERMGRAVPPVMMAHIAAAIRDGVLCRINRDVA